MSKTQTPESIHRQALELRDGGSDTECLHLLRLGCAAFPDFRDKYGHKAFAKEIARTLIGLGKYADALVELDTNGLDIDEHSILFARALQKEGNLEGARAWWITVARTRPTHPECVAFFKHNPPLPSQVAHLRAHQLADVTAHFPGSKFNVVFDVGANVGQSVADFLGHFPAATVHCFEPAPDSFEALQRSYGGHGRVVLNNLGLSDNCQSIAFRAHETSTMNRISDGSTGNLLINTSTLDLYCRTHDIRSIDYLKIDTEGHEMKVLLGATAVLSATSFVELEASMNPYNCYHASFREVSEFMFARGFHLFGIYEQTKEWGGGGIPILRRANPLFVSFSMIGELPENIIKK